LADPSVALIVLGAIAGGLVQGLSGFAFGLIAMAFWAWAVPPQLAGPMVVFGSLLGARLYRSFSAYAFRQLVLVLLLLSGIMLLVGSLPALIEHWSAGGS
jgi:hypothetical protein